jgi:K+-sensing histidine kinase KdpD
VTNHPDATETLIRLLSHDLRNPLTAMKLNAQLIERAAVRDGHDKEQRWAAFIANAAQRMDRMVQQLVEAERLRMGMLKLDLERIRLAEWISSWPASTLSGVAKDRIQITSHDPGTDVVADSCRLQQVLLTLLELVATRATESSPLCIDIRTEAATVRCSLRVPRQFPASVAAPPDASQLTAGHDIDVHHARSLIEAHGGELIVAVEEECTLGFDVVLPVSSGLAPSL